jgi:hypothetical protein
MQEDALSPDEARELAKAPEWTLDALLGKLPHVDPWWMREAVVHFHGDQKELESQLVTLMEQQPHELARTYMGLVLFFLGHPAGRSAFMNGFLSADARVRRLVINQLRIIRHDDLGRNGEPGKVPLSTDEMGATLAPLLRDPGGPELEPVLDFAVDYIGFEACRPYLHPLLRHPDVLVRGKVIYAFLENGHDDGAVQALADDLLEPGLATRAIGNRDFQREHWGRCHDIARFLREPRNPQLTPHIGRVAVGMVREALAATDLCARIEYNQGGWLNIDALLPALTFSQQPDAADILLSAATNETLPISLRALALLHHIELSGQSPACAEAILRDWAENAGDICNLDELFNGFLERNLLSMNNLVLALRNWRLRNYACAAIVSWPHGADTPCALTGLIEAVRESVALRDTRSIENAYSLLETLHQLPRSETDDQTIVDLLRQALATARASTETPWIAKKVVGILLSFGASDMADAPEIDPWDSACVHWQRKGLSLNDLLGLLAEAGILTQQEAVAPDSMHCKASDPCSQIIEMLTTSDRHRVVVGDIRDNSFDPPHHERFAELAAIVDPPLQIDAPSQSWDWKWHELSEAERRNIVPASNASSIDGVPVYSTEGTSTLVRYIHADTVRSFTARPNGSWMDVWAVIDALNALLEAENHPDRIYWLQEPSDDWYGGEYAALIAANHERFATVNVELRLPLKPREN